MASHRSVAALGALATLLLLASACANGTGATGKVAERPSMEEAIARYERLRAEAVTALDAEFGGRDWGLVPSEVFGGSMCGEDTDMSSGREIVHLPNWWMTSVYDDSRAAVEVVQEVARRHGFGEFTVVGDLAHTMIARSRDRWGGSLRMTMAEHTVLAFQTGCLVFADRAAFVPFQPGVE